MKKAFVTSSLISAFLSFFVFQAFYPAPFPESKDKQLLAKANMFNLQFPQEKIYLHLDRPSYWANDDIWFKAYLKNSPIPDCNLYVELLNSSGTVLHKKMYWAQNGMAYGDFHLEDTISSGVYQIRAYTNWMRNFEDNWFFRQNIVIWNLSDKVNGQASDPLKQNEIDFQFFPEGGTFVASQNSKMAFKATDRNGKGLDVTGKVVDDLGKEIVGFKSHFKGMGCFVIQPEDKRKYTAHLTVAGKIVMNVELPAPQTEGVALAIDPNDTAKIHIEVSVRSKSTESNSEAEYLLVGQAGGVVFYRKEILTSDGVFNLDIEKSLLPTGIVQFTLFDKEMIPRCERLVFIDHKDFVNVEIALSKPAYRARENVKLDIETLNSLGMPCLANLSISVFNPDTQLRYEDYPSNILSQFLLSSELKGTIEDPAYYFKDDSLSTVSALDNLMLTHGYRHFEWKEINEDKYPEIVYPPEESITIKGTVENMLLKKTVPNCKVTMLFVKNQYGLYEQTTDSLGHFSFSNLYFNDTVFVSLQAVNQNGKRNTWIELDKRSSISPKRGFLPVTYQYSNEIQVNTLFNLSEVSSELINRKWHLSDTILLGDINITMNKLKKGDGHVRMYVEADYVFDMDKQDDVYGNIFDMMDGRIPGVRFDPIEKKLCIRGEIPAALYLDGIPVDFELLSTFPGKIFDKIEILKFAPLAGIKGSGGAIFFYTKRGEKFVNTPADAQGLKSTNVIGYSVIRKFYSPNYESQQPTEMKNDFRSTLYWNPIVRTDSLGKASISFYNSDQTGSVQVVVEGITSDGKLCRGTGKYTVAQ